MRYEDVLVGPVGLVGDRLIEPRQHVLALDHLAEDGVKGVEVVQRMGKCEKELRTGQVFAIGDHRYQAGAVVLQLRRTASLLGDVDEAALGAVDGGVGGLAAGPTSGWVAALGNEVRLDEVKGAVVVVLQGAEGEEIAAGLGALQGEEVDGDVAQGGLDDDGHVCRGSNEGFREVPKFQGVPENQEEEVQRSSREK